MKKLSGILNRYEWLEPVVVIGVSLTITFGIISGVHKIFGQANITIADNSAEEYLYEGKYDEAITEYTDMQKTQEWPIYKVKLAEIYSLKGDYDKSNTLLKEAVINRNKLIQNSPDKYKDLDDEFINEVVFGFYMNKDYVQAQSLGEDYIMNNEPYKPLMKTMLAVYLAEGQKENAEYIVKEYPVDEQSSYDISVYAGMQGAIGDIKGALENLRRAYEMNNDDINILSVLSELINYNSEEVQSYLMEFESENSDAYKLFLAKAYLMDEGNYDSSEKILESIDGSARESLIYNIIETQLMNKTNRRDEAEKIVDKILNNDEKSYGEYYIEAEKYINEGEYEKAVESCKKSILANRDYIDNYTVLLPEILSAENNGDSIEVYFRKALLLEPFNTDMIAKIAEYYENKTEEYDKAYTYYNLALNINKEDADLYYSLGLMKAKSEKYEEAVEYFEEAISLDSENGKYYRALGTVYYNLGEDEKSIENTRIAYSLDESDITSLNNAGCYYILKGNDISRGFANIEAAYEEIYDGIDNTVKQKITDNYNKAKKIYDQYSDNNNAVISEPQLELFY